MARNLVEIILKTSGADKTAGGIKRVRSELVELAGTVGLGIGLGLITAGLAKFGKESFQAAVEGKNLRNALTITAGGADEYAEAIKLAKAATRGMIDEATLAEAINTQMATGIATNAQEAAKLVSAGVTLTAMFGSAGASVEKFNRFLSTGNDVFADNFGLSTAMIRSRRDLLMQTRGLNMQEAKLQAVRELLIESADKYEDSISAEQVALSQFSAATDDFKSALGSLLTGPGSGAIEWVTAFIKALENGALAWQGILDNGSAVMQALQTIVGQAIDNIIEILNRLGLDIEPVGDLLADIGNQALDMIPGFRAAVSAGTLLAQPIIDAKEEMDALTGATEEAAAAQDTLAETTENTQLTLQRMRGQRFVNDLADQMAGATGNTPDFADYVNARQKAEKAAADKAQDAWNDALQTLRSAVTSALQPTLNEVWTPPEKGRIDEWARRAATLTTDGLNSEWIGALQQQFGGTSFWQPIADAIESGDEGALKQAATELLTTGASQMWDKELIKQRVRESLEQQNMRQELIDTIMAELQGEGLDVQLADVQTAMGGGLPVAGSIATGLGEQLPAAMTEANVGSTLINTINNLVKANERDFERLATTFAERFDTYLPTALKTTAVTFMETITNEVAQRLGLAAGARP